MKYCSALAKEERSRIFELFTKDSRLKFCQIEKAINIRSNMVSYHLEQMLAEGLLEKKDEHYMLTGEAERYIPIVKHLKGESLSPLPVVLAGLVDNKGRILLIKRNKRPYQGYWSMIGGKVGHDESLEEAAKRHIRRKAGIDAELGSVNSVLHERVRGNGIIKHSFILMFVRMVPTKTDTRESASGELRWICLDGIEKERIIPSDLWLIKNKLNTTTDFNTCSMEEDRGELSSFMIHL